MVRANGSHKWLDRNQSVHEDLAPPSIYSSAFKSHITLMEWENDGARTQSKSDLKQRGIEDV